MYRVEITERAADPHHDHASLNVQPFVKIGRKEYRMRFAWGLKIGDRALAERLKRAVEAGAVFAEPELKTDVHGDKYATADFRSYVRGRALNADLRRLGF